MKRCLLLKKMFNDLVWQTWWPNFNHRNWNNRNKPQISIYLFLIFLWLCCYIYLASLWWYIVDQNCSCLILWHVSWQMGMYSMTDRSLYSGAGQWTSLWTDWCFSHLFISLSVVMGELGLCTLILVIPLQFQLCYC